MTTATTIVKIITTDRRRVVCEGEKSVVCSGSRVLRPTAAVGLTKLCSVAIRRRRDVRGMFKTGEMNDDHRCNSKVNDKYDNIPTKYYSERRNAVDDDFRAFNRISRPIARLAGEPGSWFFSLVI